MDPTRRIVYDFRGAISPPVVASRVGIWCSKITKTAGSPTCASVSGGPMELALDNTNEVQNVCLYMGDILPFDIDDILRVEFVAKISASLGDTVTAVMGLATARNDDPDAVVDNAYFKCALSNTVVVETDDGTNDNDDKATGDTLAATYKRLVIDIASGTYTKSPPSASVGGKGDVRFYMSNSNNSLRRVASGTQFDMSNFSSNLQLLAQIQKTASTDTGTLSILEAAIELKLPA